ncbi:MFS general substrate transporter [Coprinopsis marcescibilis]|uniref:MFS general substrate transporter n=1 Tax=Coprinopsis marcescibilis TaxID=230819 RepID=A0A5C3KRZ6_COPMA|nr:MFS general substrate transporter [Coprinopsis marcescibilis]
MVEQSTAPVVENESEKVEASEKSLELDDKVESVREEDGETQHYVIDPEAEKRLLRKTDWVLLPMFTAICETSIGNARVAGLERDLGMQGFDLNIALTIFYIFYILSDIPSNLALKHFGSNWLSGLVIGFGLVTTFSAFMTSYQGLIASRVFLGIFEGGTLSALVYVMARYYRRHELVLRIGIFFGVSPSLAGAFGGLLASGLLRLPDFGIIKTWRKIFLIEGVITTIFGLVLLFILPEDPTKSRLLTEEERKLALARIDADQVIKTKGKKEKTTWPLILSSFNFITCACVLCYLLINMSFQGLSLFLPSVINSFGTYTVIEVQLRTVPPYMASAVWVVLNAYISARLKMRCIPLFYNTLIVVSGYTIAVSTNNPQARYAACFLILMGASVCGPMIMTWGTDNAAPDTMRAVVTAAIPGFGAFGAVMAVWTYLPTDAPNYRNGNTGNLSTSSTVCVIVVITALYIRWENRKRARGDRDERLEGKSQDEQAKMGWRHPRFKYQI